VIHQYAYRWLVRHCGGLIADARNVANVAKPTAFGMLRLERPIHGRHFGAEV